MAREKILYGDLILSNDEIEPLYKQEPPYTRSDFGYMGVVLYHTKKDAVHCHVCGEFVKHLPSHCYNKHRIRNREYRIKYGLPMIAPLVAKGITRSLRDQATKKNWKEHNVKHRFKKGVKHKKYNNAKYARNSAAFKNTFGSCDKQLYNRYLIVADKIGRDPSDLDFREHDSKWIDLVRTRHGSINKFKMIYGFEIYQFKRPKKKIGPIRKELYKYIKNGKFTENQKLALKSMRGIKDSDLSEIQCQQILDIYQDSGLYEQTK